MHHRTRRPLTLVLTVAVLTVLGWGVTRSLARSAPIALHWEAAWWFVGASLLLMLVGVGTTLYCVLTGPRRPGRPDGSS